MACSTLAPDWIWWDSCTHFIAVRVLEYLIYPNVNNRVSLYYIQELLQYLDNCIIENHDYYNKDPSNCCMYHDNPTTNISVMDFVSDNVKRLGLGFKSSRYTLSVSYQTSQPLHPLQRFVKQLLQYIPSQHRFVFLRSGLEYSGFLPDVLKFLLPHLLLFTLTHLPENNEEIAIRIGKTVVHILDLATMHSESSTTSIGMPDETFILFDPTTTCQILFSAIDNLAQLVHVYSKIDVETHSNLETQSFENPQLRQSMSLSLPAHAWLYLQLVLRVCRGSNAAVAACKIGAFSRCLFYLESTLFSKGVTSSVVDSMMNLPKELDNYTSTFVPIFIDAFRGLQDWENIRGCLEAVTISKDKDIFIDRLALTLESQNEPMVIAWEYTRLSRMNHVKSDDFRSKALHSFLDARDINTFLLEYEKSSGAVKAACLPLFMKSLWKQGLWTVLEYLYVKYSDTIRISTCSASSNELLIKDATGERTTFHQASNYPCIEYDIPPSIIELPSPGEIDLAASTWSMQDRLDFLIAGVLSAVHQKNFSLTHNRLERFSKIAAASLATTTRETYFRSHLTLLPLQLSTDLKQLIQITQEKNMSEELLMERVKVVVNSSPPLIEVLDTMKVALEELNCLRTAAMVSIRLSKVLRKTILYPPHASRFNPVTLCGKHQLTDYLRFFDTASNDDMLMRALRTELSKCVPSSMRLSLLEPLTTVDDKIAVRYAKLSVSTTHLLPEKLQMLQKVVEHHPQSEKAHRCLAELLDTQIYDWSSRTFKTCQKTEYSDMECPQSALDDLPNFPKGWSMISLVESAIYHHLEAAAWSKSTQRARFHLLKFLQLLVDIFFREKTVNKNEDVPSVGTGNNMNHATVQKIFIQKIFTLIKDPFDRIPISYWYLEVSQLVARCQHKQLGPKIFQPLLARLLLHMPQKMAWHLGPWFCSERSERHVTANNVLKAARELEDNVSNSLLVFYVERTATFISCLVSLANATLTPVSQQQESPSKNKVKLSKELPELSRILSSVIVANGSTNSILLPLLSQLDASGSNVNSNCTFVHHIDDTMLIMRSKQRPKKLLFKGSDGFDYPWLVKKESRGDLRKDARLMEVAGYVNEWMEKVEKIKEKNLKIQRYSVIPLNEITGLIEWLPHLVTLRCAVLELLETHLGQDKFMNFMKKVISRYNRHKHNPSALFTDFQETLKIFKPVLQEFFFERYGINVAVWYECRKTYCESLASWSVLGYVFGLGDRHGENILINIKTGQIVHVDFDCLFEKGLKLPVPEIVPFRLTQNLIAGLGFGGLKGRFLSACVDTLITLKEYQTDFLSLLQSFVFDPLIEWTRVGKNGYSQQEEDYEGGGLRATKYLQDVKVKLIGGLNCRSQKLLKPSSTLCTAGSQKSQQNSQLKVEEIYNYVTTWVVEPNITVETQDGCLGYR
ncbi:uncharacterized protein LOC128883761 isoform X2 [Hylaeus volcanicus]|uniref:uncharacterized protein LOC128883761 isoform X2 n=1 Tax=Hylaeus volcanicus TaxID=313075 RepID=UPI0023B86E76|nr:uncharacterized protein LOC128883761 isoform X2 [Hylaeus volcanicus]XP_053992425.1 uncharacterized protein LOC128883761 isoform X2 [Hylaeus volcanicus]